MKLGTVDPIRNIEDLETVSLFGWHFRKATKASQDHWLEVSFTMQRCTNVKRRCAPPDLTVTTDQTTALHW